MEHFALYGWVFLILGMAGAVLGILFALPQNNLKRLLAYSSIENIGIMSMGFGFGFLGISSGNTVVAACGFTGGFLHLINHALLKGGLFLCAGNILKAVRTLELDEMGGLFKRMPLTGLLFTLNSAGICGLPPFNGFLSEFLIYLAAICMIAAGGSAFFAVSIAALILLALTGGLAAAAFAKAVGAAFLGEPRTAKAAEAQEMPRCMTMPIVILFAGSILLVAAVPLLLPLLAAGNGFFEAEWEMIQPVLMRVSYFSLLLVLLSAVLLWIRFRVLSRGNRTSGTWDCGFAGPTARMEYTGTAFTQPLTDFFHTLLHPLKKLILPKGFFPAEAAFEEEIPDGGERSIWAPLFNGFARVAEKLHLLQSGYLHFYLLIAVITLLLMLVIGLYIPVEVLK
jgi:formate hydrogenlyase subunit 3/multisubunit Na+/H+ antiporter MnhD subunit